MASPMTIEHCLYEFCANWGRGQDHMNKVSGAWYREFESTPDRVLDDAIKQLIRSRTDSFIPCLGVVIDNVKALMGGTHTDRSYLKCRDCTPQGGRYVAIHYEHAPERFMGHQGQPFVHVFAAPCSCDRGRRTAGRNLSDVITTLEETREHGRPDGMHSDTIRCYHVSTKGGDLTKREKTLDEEYQIWLHQKPDPSDNPYRKMLFALLQGRRASERRST